MEADFNENDDNFLCAFEDELAWNTNPLFNNNNNKGSTSEDFVQESKTNYREPKLANGVNTGEYETESGYSETVSIVSELSSPDPSVYSNLSFSDVDEETEFLSDITESMRRAAILPPVSNDIEGTASGIIPAQIVSSKGTVRGVKNRVRENILHFLSSGQNGQKQKWRKAGDEEVGQSCCCLSIFHYFLYMAMRYLKLHPSELYSITRGESTKFLTLLAGYEIKSVR